MELKMKHMGTILLMLVFFHGTESKNKNMVTNDVEEYIKSRYLREAGFKDFDISRFVEDNGEQISEINSEEIHRRKRSLDAYSDDLSLKINAFQEDLNISLTHTKSVLHPDAVIITSIGSERETWTGEHPDCFLTGDLKSQTGTASFSFCNGLKGAITTNEHEYQLETLPQRLHKRDTHSNVLNNVLVSRRPLKEAFQGIDSINVENGARDLHHRRKRYVPPSTSFTIELAVYTDEAFTKIFASADRAARIESLLTKYNGVQMEYTRTAQLGYNVSISIKYIEFLDTNPAWYTESSTLSNELNDICQHTKNDNYDHVFMHSGVANPSPSGLAYQSTICKSEHKCGISASKSVVTYVATAHEIGHNLGMVHDDASRNCGDPTTGVMGGYGAGWSACNKQDMQDVIASGDAACLWTENIAAGSVSADLQSITLEPRLIGQIYTADEICEKMYKDGYRLREYPQINVCAQYSCIDMNRGTNSYGKMTIETESINGLFCEDGKICFSGNCETWATARQDDLTKQPGGWSDWGEWVTCTRTCGTGIKSRRRLCNNPRPSNMPSCDGEEYEAELCNKSPCFNDSSDEATLKTQRATETCASLVTNGVIDGNNYHSTGTVYNDIRMGKCEVSCDAKTGYTVPTYTRYGLMPDGSPCSSDEISTLDKDDWPRRPGFNDHCLDGYCQLFGCDDKINGKSFDECGVCGGDNSTCTVESGTYTTTLAAKTREQVWTLPAGTFNMQFSFTYSTMKKIGLEIYDKDGTAILGTYIFASQEQDTRSKPINFAGTFWYYVFSKQYLYAKGPLTEPAIIKVYSNAGNTNTGITYVYSLPKDIASCTGTCLNGGAWDSSICGCTCPGGAFGANCSATCGKYCYNGGYQNPCDCTCTEYSYDSKCKTCKAVFTGENCRSCKYHTCQNCGVLNSTSCRCQCPDGFGGFQCEKQCADSRETCAADAAAGKCESDNVNMEADCPLSCNLCVAKTPSDECNGFSYTTPSTEGPTSVTTDSITAADVSATNTNSVTNSDSPVSESSSLTTVSTAETQTKNCSGQQSTSDVSDCMDNGGYNIHVFTAEFLVLCVSVCYCVISILKL